MRSNIFLLLWLILLFNPSWSRHLEQPTTTQQGVLNEIFSKGYDVNECPTASSKSPTTVTVQIFVNSFGSLDAQHMEYSIDIFLRQMWQDPRLAFDNKNLEYIVVQDPKTRDKIWKPDTYFMNVKEAQMHTVTMPNVLFRINSTGHILYSMRLNLKLSCNMDFAAYPIDIQRCEILVTSYSNTDFVIKYKWIDEDPIVVPNTIEIAQFDLVVGKNPKSSFEIENKSYVFSTGNFSGLQAHFALIRQNGYHLLQTYIPTILIVCISWVSFWLDPNAVPGRITLGATTLLTLATLASGSRKQLPPVSYIKAIDIWIGMCMFMVFGALLEFTVVNWLANKKKTIKRRTCAISRIEMFVEERKVAIPPSTYLSEARAIDRASRVFFPGIFMIFNAVYWCFYIMTQYFQKTSLNRE